MDTQQQQLIREIQHTVPLYGNQCYHCNGPLAVIYQRRGYPGGEMLFCSNNCYMDWQFDLRRRHRFLNKSEESFMYVFK